MENKKKNPWIAVLLSLLMVGLGHAYIKKWWTFLGFVVMAIVAYLFDLHLIIAIVAIVYAYIDTKEYNKNLN